MLSVLQVSNTFGMPKLNYDSTAFQVKTKLLLQVYCLLKAS